tara:strand:+ start:317 stop:961 length:645 start_codon:yes stop_codon:yes gene_type:complete
MEEQLPTVDIKGKPYVEVKTRVQWFRKNIENGSIETEILHFDNESIMCKTKVHVNGALVATGMAHEDKNASAVNKTSFVECCETSSVGRALGMLGIGIATSVDTAGTVAAAIAQQEATERHDELMRYKAESLSSKLMMAIESDDEEGVSEVEKDYRGDTPLATRVKLSLTPEHLEYMDERKERLSSERKDKKEQKEAKNQAYAKAYAKKNTEAK